MSVITPPPAETGNFVIREMAPNDVPAIRNLQEAAMAGVGIEDSEVVESFEDVQESYLNDGGTLLVGEVDGEIVAMGALRRQNAERGKIERMSTRPGLQKRGFGRQVLRALEERAEAQGIVDLFLTTSDQQPGAVSLYEGEGYNRFGRPMPHQDYKLLFFKKRIQASDG